MLVQQEDAQGGSRCESERDHSSYPRQLAHCMHSGKDKVIKSATNPQIPSMPCKPGAEINLLFTRFSMNLRVQQIFPDLARAEQLGTCSHWSRLLAANDLFVIYISMSGKYGLIALSTAEEVSTVKAI